MSTRDRERVLWAWLKRGVPQRSHVHRIEDTSKKGTPDVEGCITGDAFWIELKVAHEQPTRGTVRVDTTAHQVFFALRRWECGGTSWYLLRVGRGSYGAEHYLVPGSHAEALLDKPIDLAWLRTVTACDPNATAAEVLEAARRRK